MFGQPHCKKFSYFLQHGSINIFFRWSKYAKAQNGLFSRRINLKTERSRRKRTVRIRKTPSWSRRRLSRLLMGRLSCNAPSRLQLWMETLTRNGATRDSSTVVNTLVKCTSRVKQSLLKVDIRTLLNSQKKTRIFAQICNKNILKHSRIIFLGEMTRVTATKQLSDFEAPLSEPTTRRLSCKPPKIMLQGTNETCCSSSAPSQTFKILSISKKWDSEEDSDDCLECYCRKLSLSLDDDCPVSTEAHCVAASGAHLILTPPPSSNKQFTKCIFWVPYCRPTAPSNNSILQRVFCINICWFLFAQCLYAYYLAQNLIGSPLKILTRAREGISQKLFRHLRLTEFRVTKIPYPHFTHSKLIIMKNPRRKILNNDWKR